jgi:hypothetical protein
MGKNSETYRLQLPIFETKVRKPELMLNYDGHRSRDS